MKISQALADRLPSYKMIMQYKSHRMIHPVYSLNEIEKVANPHKKPDKIRDYIAIGFLKALRGTFDYVTRFNEEKMTEKQWVTRTIFLETVASVPGFVAAMHRHMRSLRTMQRDHGWIHHLLEESENERVHLFTFLHLSTPGLLTRMMVVVAQGIFFNSYFLAYMLSPKFCHTFVGYLEEQAVHTYTILLR